MKKSRLISLMLVFTLALGYIPFLPKQAKAAGETELDITADNIVITATGASGGGLASDETALNENGYIIKGHETSTTHTITVAGGISAPVIITLEDVIISSTKPPIAINSPTTLKLKGQSIVTASANYSAGVYVKTGASLNICNADPENPGSINATGARAAAGIGGGSGMSSGAVNGAITIDSGYVIATGGGGGAGIGAGSGNGTAGAITINGGVVTATGSTYTTRHAAGIGGAGNVKYSSITINGGSVIAKASREDTATETYAAIGDATTTTATHDGNPIIITGGMIEGAVQGKPVAAMGGADPVYVYKVSISHTQFAGSTVQVTVGSNAPWETQANSSGTIVTYLPEAEAEITASCAGLNYSGHLEAYSGADRIVNMTLLSGSCDCTTGTAHIDFPAQDYFINKNVSSVTYTLSASFVQSPTCEYTAHQAVPTYEFVTDPGSSSAVISGQSLTLYKPCIGQTIEIRVTMNVNGTEYTATQSFTITEQDKTILDLAKGSITVVDNETVTCGGTTYTIGADEPIYIKQSIPSAATSNYIEVKPNVTKTITITDINIERDNAYTSPIHINGKSNVKLILEGENNVKSTYHRTTAVSCEYQSTLTIEGDGKLNVISTSEGAGIGSTSTSGEIIINSGEIHASATDGSAAIGSAKDSAPPIITINGGKVYATSTDGVGIGAGLNAAARPAASPSKITVNGGYVESTSQAGTNGLNGTIYLNGGSIKPSYMSSVEQKKDDGTKVYPVVLTVEDPIGMQAVTYTLNETGTPISTYTDSDSKLYLYLPTGEQSVQMTYNGTTYRCKLTPSPTGTSTATLCKTSEQSITSFEIYGQIGETQIDQEAKTIRVTMPSNKYLGALTPVLELEGATGYTPEGATNFIGSDTTPVTYTVIGVSGYTTDYSVYVTQDTSSIDKATVIDLSKVNSIQFTTRPIGGSTERCVIINGTSEYPVNTNGYILTGAATNIKIFVETDFSDIPITLKDADIQSPYPIQFNDTSKAVITLDGNNVIHPTSTVPAINLTAGELTFNGDSGTLDIKGGENAPAIGVQGNVSDDMGTVKIESGRFLITGGTGFGAVGTGGANTNTYDGHFTIDGGSVHLVDGSSGKSIQPKNSAGDNVYPMVVTVTDLSNNLLKNSLLSYSNDSGTTQQTVMTDAEGKLYVYSVPNTYEDTLTGIDTDVKYYGKGSVSTTGGTGFLTVPTATSLTYVDPKTSKESTILFGVLGKYLNGDIKITVTDDTGTVIDTVTLTATNRQAYSASITFPENKDTKKDMIYHIKLTIDGREQAASQNRTLTILKTLEIDNFTINGQASSVIDQDLNTITVYMPYDTTNFTFTPIVSHNGAKYGPTNGRTFANETPVTYTVYASDPADTSPTVSKDSRTYKAVVHVQDTPTANGITFTNPADYKASTIDVVVDGEHLENAQYAMTHSKSILVTATPKNHADTINPISAAAVYDETKDQWIASLAIPENEDRTAAQEYTLSVSIGGVDQTLTGSDLTLTVPRKPQNITTVENFVVPHQAGDATVDNEEKEIYITMEYDASLKNLKPTVTLTDENAAYTPTTARDFDTKPIIYTILAEDKETQAEYRVNVSIQEPPVVTGLDFENPKKSNGGNITVVVTGEHLDSAREIEIAGDNGITAGIVQYDEESKQFVAIIRAPANEDTENSAKHDLHVIVDNNEQTLETPKQVVVPRKNKNEKEITEFSLTIKEQKYDGVITEVGEDGGTIAITVPYSTDLRDLTPAYDDCGVSRTPSADTPQDFNVPVDYTITAENGSTRTYKVTVTRDGTPEIVTQTRTEPKTFKDTVVNISVTGNMLPYINDTLKYDTVTATAVSNDDPSAEPIQSEIVSQFFGSAVISLTLPANYDTTADKTYTITSLKINDTEFDLTGDNTITVPRRKTKKITEFVFPNVQAPTVIDDVNNTITITVPYSDNIMNIEPTVTIDGDRYYPERAHNFRRPLSYRVTAEDDEEEKEYQIVMKYIGGPELSGIEILSTPQDFRGGQAELNVTGIFHDRAEITATAADGTVVNSEMTEFTDGDSAKAHLIMNFPQNEDDDNTKPYTLTLSLDGIPITLTENNEIVVPRKPKNGKDILSFTLERQYRETTITENTITLQSIDPVENLKPIIEVSANATVSPTGPQDFSSPVTYIVTAEDGTTKEYVVTITKRAGGMPIRPDMGQPIQPTDEPAKPTDEPAKPTDEPIKPTDEPSKLTTHQTYINGYPDKMFRPENNITRAEVTKIFSILSDDYDENTTYGTSFRDIGANDWYTNYVGFMSQKGLVKGYAENNTFRPENNITRAEFALIAARFGNIKPSANITFSDTPDMWNKEYISALAQKGVITGYPDGTFRPNQTITRAEAVTMLNRLIENTPDQDAIDKLDNVFTDVNRSYWAYYEIMTAACDY